MTDEPELQRYEVVLLDHRTGNKRSEFYIAQSFGNAQDLAERDRDSDEVIAITKEYEKWSREY